MEEFYRKYVYSNFPNTSLSVEEPGVKEMRLKNPKLRGYAFFIFCERIRLV